ncbi:MAG: chitobiase/beta-hexosaminidase C-terminal domain-containing protein [Bacteroidaceae bacterium]|nr:chitobiase/beta-hexosaminidase C-terminal domain-containing protein [Bacteroidaceae bacterium]
MAQQDRATLKSFFRTGAYPTEQQFADLIDSLRHHTDSIGMGMVEGLYDALNGKAPQEIAVKVEEILRKIETGEIGGMTPEEKAAFEKMRQMFTVDETNRLLKVKGDTKNWVVGLTEQIAVNAPAISLPAEFTDTTSARFRLTNGTAGAEMFYTTGAGEPTTSAGTGATKDISQAVTFADKTGAGFDEASTATFTVKALAKLNGVTSETATASLTVMRQVEAAACSASANYEFDTAPTFTIDKKGADEVRYTTDGSEPTADSASYVAPFGLPQAVTESVSGTAVTIRTLSRRKKGYADNTKSFAFTVGRCSAYQGVMDVPPTASTFKTLAKNNSRDLKTGVMGTEGVRKYHVFVLPKDRTLTSATMTSKSFTSDPELTQVTLASTVPYNVYYTTNKLDGAIDWTKFI